MMIDYGSVDGMKASDMPKVPYFVAIEANYEILSDAAIYQIAEIFLNTDAMWVAGVGKEATKLDDAVDWLAVERDLDQGYEGSSIMTTWHHDETLGDVIEFLETVTPMEGWDMDKWPIIAIRIAL